MPVDDREQSGRGFQRSPTGPRVTPPRPASNPTQPPRPEPRPRRLYRRTPILSTVIFSLIVLGVGFGLLLYYRTVTGVDLSVSTNAVRLAAESYMQPSLLLRNRLTTQRPPARDQSARQLT